MQFEAPLMAFGGIAIDQVGPVRDFPSASMIVGLVANALGWRWGDSDAHQALQDRLVFGARRDGEGAIVTDVQNVRLERTDRGWTTDGAPEGRTGASYDAPHRRVRDYHAELAVRVVARLEPSDAEPDIDRMAAALDSPARPLFLGRKPCLPSRPILAPGSGRWTQGENAYEALRSLPGAAEARACWPRGEGPSDGEAVDRAVLLPDQRNWRSGVHAGARPVVEGRLVPDAQA